ncbi:hypothetical protein BpHYR1_042874 [Brachionus plicatilis]|uniref:Uncharacterized protein n=1 Tax=Brachionus plicatilis TaxID=10195 RepID=A0A3M7SER8_BRAPC|nr:hypothetical protein BpHYR1_042874 [Brachionus plicatilis]
MNKLALLNILYLEITDFSNWCGNDSCSNWLHNNYPDFKQNSRSLGSRTAQNGYNKIIFPTPVRAKKGQILMIHISVADMLAIDSSEDIIQSDYFVSESKIKKLNGNSNWRFFVNALIDTKYYKKIIQVSRAFPTLTNQSFGIYSITARFENSTITRTRFFNVTNKEYTYFVCQYPFIMYNRTVNCTLNALLSHNYYQADVFYGQDGHQILNASKSKFLLLKDKMKNLFVSILSESLWTHSLKIRKYLTSLNRAMAILFQHNKFLISTMKKTFNIIRFLLSTKYYWKLVEVRN